VDSTGVLLTLLRAFLAGMALAKETLLLGRPIHAERAVAIDLVTAAVPGCRAGPAVANLRAELMKKDPIVLGDQTTPGFDREVGSGDGGSR
jgi:enoyl-CoA hydratase/carnithine racemase